MYTTLSTQPVTLNLHHYSVLANESSLHPSLAAFFRPLATNTVDGVEFVSLMEGRQLPFYASQFHGEKNAFEWVSPNPKPSPAVHTHRRGVGGLKGSTVCWGRGCFHSRLAVHTHRRGVPREASGLI